MYIWTTQPVPDVYVHTDDTQAVDSMHFDKGTNSALLKKEGEIQKGSYYVLYMTVHLIRSSLEIFEEISHLFLAVRRFSEQFLKLIC